MTTGSAVQGTVDGMSRGFEQRDLMYVGANPSGTVTAGVGSTLAHDTANGKFYMYKTDQNWIELGSVEFS